MQFITAPCHTRVEDNRRRFYRPVFVVLKLYTRFPPQNKPTGIISFSTPPVKPTSLTCGGPTKLMPSRLTPLSLNPASLASYPAESGSIPLVSDYLWTPKCRYTLPAVMELFIFLWGITMDITAQKNTGVLCNRATSDPLLSAETLAGMLSLSKRTIFRLNSSGRLPKPLRIGGSLRWKSGDILRWIELGCCSRAEFNTKSSAGNISNN